MASVNKVILIGNLGRDPEMRYTPNGQPNTQFSIATSRSWKKDDEWQEETTWHNIVMWGQRAERAAENFRKGMQVYVEGRIENRSWDDKETGQKKYKTEIIADVAYAMGRREEQSSEYEPVAGDFGAPVASTPRPAAAPSRSELDDLPF